LPIQLQKANQLPSFDVHWIVRAGSRVIAQHTRFQRFLVGRPSADQDLGGPGALDDDVPSLPGARPDDE
jgi:hypothetical protein